MEGERQERDNSGRKDSQVSRVEISVAGATGYTGAELIRILTGHPNVEIKHISGIEVGRRLQDVIPAMKSICELEIEPLEEVLEADVVFLCLPNNLPHKLASKVKGRMIDLSADFRFKRPEDYKHVYGFEHSSPELIKKAIYGLTEFVKEDLKVAEIVANPGCYPTAFLLATVPILREFKVDEIKVDAKSGVTGAGRNPKLSLMLGELADNFKVYATWEHKHVPEMSFYLEEFGGGNPEILFCAQLIPIRRGILETIWIRTREPVKEDRIWEVLEQAYKHSPFVEVSEGFPEISQVVGTNLCRLGVKVKGRTILVISCIDNLGKGAAGQAVQNMNVMLGLEETAGLKLAPLI